MRFHLSAEQVAIQDAVRGTLADSWPLARLHAFADGDTDLDRASWDALMALGLAGMLAPDSGMGLLDAALACEVVGEAAGSGPLIGQMLATWAVAHSGAAPDLLDDLTSGAKVASLALGDAPLVQAARSADYFIVGSRDSGIVLVEAEGTAIEPVQSTDRSRPLSRVSFGDAWRGELFPAGPCTTIVSRLPSTASTKISRGDVFSPLSASYAI